MAGAVDGPVFNRVTLFQGIGRGTAVCLLTAALGTLPLANQNYDWPNPRGPVYTNSLYSFKDSFKLPLTTVTPKGRLLDWPNPQRPRRNELLGWFQDGIPNLLAVVAARPFQNFDWPNPRGARPNQPLGWLDTFDPGRLLPPFAQKDWTNPSRGPQRASDYTWKDSFKLPLTTHTPNGRLLDWPNPQPPKRRNEQLGFVYSVSHLIGGAGESQPLNQFNWPNPVLRGGIPTFLQKFEDHYSIEDIPALQRWDNPNPPLGARGIYAGIFSLGGDVSVITPVPANQFDWPVPKGRQPTQWRTWTDSFKLTLTTVRPAGANKDWPNPRGYVPAITLRTWTDSFKLPLTTTVAAGRLLDWPNPRGKAPPAVGWLNQSLSLSFVEQQRPTIAQDWPNPRGYARTDLRTWTARFPLPLTTVTPSGANKDWPNPQRVLRTDNLRWTQGPFLGTQATGARPFYQTEWPNPRNIRRRATPSPIAQDVVVDDRGSPGACIVGGYFSKGQWRTVIGTPCPPKKRRSYKEPGFSRQQYEDLLEAIQTGEYQPSQRKVKRWFESGAFTRAQFDDIKATIRLEQETRAQQEKLAAEAQAFAEARAHEDRLAAIEAQAQAAQAQNALQAHAAQVEAASRLQSLQQHMRLSEAVATAARRAKAEEEDDEKAIAMLFSDD